MEHPFLYTPGLWKVTGHQTLSRQHSIPLQGTIQVNWDQTDWFSISSKLATEKEEILSQYRGHLDPERHCYTFVTQHNQLGRIEGEGWITPSAILHRYWVLGEDRQKRSGFESFVRMTAQHYGYTNSLVTGLRLYSSIDAVLERGKG